MKITTREKWIEAGIILASGDTHKVACPECAKENLKIEDIYDEQDRNIIMEKMIYCPLCNAKQFILKPKLKN